METLKKLKINKSYFKKNITSGEYLLNYSKKNKKLSNIFNLKYCYLISNGKEDYLLKQLKLVNEKIENAKFILATSIKPKKNINIYKSKLNFLKKKNLVMICSNPDKKTIDKNNKFFQKQVGSLANYYEKIKGKVFYIGKPYIDIFKFALKNIKKKEKVLMIGDTLETDILGANNAGIHSALVLNNNYKKTKQSFKNEFAKKKILPNYLIIYISI